MTAETDEIKRDHFELLKGRRLIILVEADYGFNVEQWLPDGVAPTSCYDTAQEAAARALQLLGLTEPVTPQDWAEVAQIGGAPSPPPKPETKAV
tara:strand:+ start:269 stop:550 length:282 start_codon:yes stop_codon:yes gene_type:complete